MPCRHVCQLVEARQRLGREPFVTFQRQPVPPRAVSANHAKVVGQPRVCYRSAGLQSVTLRHLV